MHKQKPMGEHAAIPIERITRSILLIPDHFMFQLTADETAFLRSQFVTLKTGSGRPRKYRPYAFTEQGKSGRRARVCLPPDILQTLIISNT
jgi:hypothetical protein